MQKLQHIGSINRSLAPKYIKYRGIEIILIGQPRGYLRGDLSRGGC